MNLTHVIYPHDPIGEKSDDFRSQGIFFRDYYPNGEWNIIRAPAIRNQKEYSCCLQPYYDITYSLVLQRKTLFYIVYLIVPCVGISFLTLMVFYLPSESGEKIVLSISIELALTVIFPLLAAFIPSTSIMIPLLSKYFLFIMLLVAISLIKTVLILAIYYRNSNHLQPMPRWIERLFIEILPDFLFFKSTKINRRSSNHREKLPTIDRLDDDDGTVQSKFIRILEKSLRLVDLNQIFDRFRASNLHDQVCSSSRLNESQRK